MNQPFAPLNDLERALVAAMQNQLPASSLVQTLRTAQVFVLTDRQAGPGGLSDSGIAPMVLANADKTPFLAVYTAPERADAWLKRQTRFRDVLGLDFAALLQAMAPDLGIAINPGLQAGFELQAGTVAQLRAQEK